MRYNQTCLLWLKTEEFNYKSFRPAGFLSFSTPRGATAFSSVFHVAQFSDVSGKILTRENVSQGQFIENIILFMRKGKQERFKVA